MADKASDRPEYRGVIGNVKKGLNAPVARDLGRGFKDGALGNLGTTYSPLYMMPVALGFVTALGAVCAISMDGDLRPLTSEAQKDASLTSGFGEASGYQAMSAQGREIVLVKDGGAVWRVYEVARDREGDRELRFVADRNQAFRYVSEMRDAMRDVVRAYENFEVMPERAAQIVQYEHVSKLYEEDGAKARSAGPASPIAVPGQNVREAYGRAVTDWTQAAEDIVNGGYGFREDSTPVQTMAERPDATWLDGMKGVGLYFGLPVIAAFGMLGMATAGIEARRGRRRRKLGY